MLRAVRTTQRERPFWRLNEDLLFSKENIEYLRQETKIFFKINWGKQMNSFTVWDTYKAYMRGPLTMLNIKERKQR